MKIIFLFDQMDAEGKITATDVNPYVITPDKLQLRQMAPGQTGLGVSVEKVDEQGQPQQVFYSIITFPINISLPAPPPAVTAAPVEAPAAVAEVKATKPNDAIKKAKKSGK